MNVYRAASLSALLSTIRTISSFDSPLSIRRPPTGFSSRTHWLLNEAGHDPAGNMRRSVRNKSNTSLEDHFSALLSLGGHSAAVKVSPLHRGRPRPPLHRYQRSQNSPRRNQPASKLPQEANMQATAGAVARGQHSLKMSIPLLISLMMWRFRSLFEKFVLSSGLCLEVTSGHELGTGRRDGIGSLHRGNPGEAALKFLWRHGESPIGG